MLNSEDIYFSKLKNFLENKGLNPLKIEPLTPDASTRRYFRLFFPDSSKIAMVIGELDRKIIFEEIMEKQINFEELPFVNIGRFLRKNGVKVPEIYIDGKEVLILEDFGSVPLDVFVKQNGLEKALPFYYSAISELVKMQTSEEDRKCYAFELSFSERMFLWEFNHFTEYFMGFRLEEDKEMQKEFTEISKALSKTRYVFTHRDFHSKNLMCLENYMVGILDFQDALLAPYTYDLVSLTADAYVDIDESTEKILVERYKELAGEKILTEDFEDLYNMTAVQRTLKAAGRFMYIFKQKRNEKFLPYVIPAASKGIRYMKKLKMNSWRKVQEMFLSLNIPQKA